MSGFIDYAALQDAYRYAQQWGELGSIGLLHRVIMSARASGYPGPYFLGYPPAIQSEKLIQGLKGWEARVCYEIPQSV